MTYLNLLSTNLLCLVLLLLLLLWILLRHCVRASHCHRRCGRHVHCRVRPLSDGGAGQLRSDWRKRSAIGLAEMICRHLTGANPTKHRRRDPMSGVQRFLRLSAAEAEAAMRPTLVAGKWKQPLLSGRKVAMVKKHAARNGLLGTWEAGKGGWLETWDRPQQHHVMRPLKGHKNQRNEFDRYVMALLVLLLLLLLCVCVCVESRGGLTLLWLCCVGIASRRCRQRWQRCLARLLTTRRRSSRQSR